MGPRPDYISYFDPVVEFYIVDVIAFLKQDRERYGFKRVKEEKQSIISDSSSLLTDSNEDRAYILNKSQTNAQ